MSSSSSSSSSGLDAVSSAWVFTANNILVPSTFNWRFSTIVFASWQHEDAGTPHTQGYFETTRNYTLKVMISALQKKIPGAHIEIRRGTQDEAIAYTEKSDTRIAGPFKYGTQKPGQGSRSDIHTAISTLKRTRDLKQVAELHTPEFVKYHRGFELYLSLTDTRERAWKTQIRIYWGKSRTGKSYRATQEAKALGGGVFYLQRPSSGSTVWWDGYDGQDNIIIDEYYGWIVISDFLRFLDSYPMRVQVKGSSRTFLAHTIFITSNIHWSKWYARHFEKFPEHVEAIQNRIDEGGVCEEMLGHWSTHSAPSSSSTESNSSDSLPSSITHLLRENGIVDSQASTEILSQTLADPHRGLPTHHSTDIDYEAKYQDDELLCQETDATTWVDSLLSPSSRTARGSQWSLD